MSSSMKIGFYQKGLKVWISNPYPADDENHFKKALPNSTRPLFVPAQVESKTVRGPTLAAAPAHVLLCALEHACVRLRVHRYALVAAVFSSPPPWCLLRQADKVTVKTIWSPPLTITERVCDLNLSSHA